MIGALLKGIRGRPAGRYSILALKLSVRHKSNGGLTWHLIRGNVPDDPAVKASKYVGIVSVYPSRGEVVDRAPSEEDFEHFIMKNELMLSVPSNWLCIGSWHDKDSGKHYIDISQVCFTYDQAARLGREHKQETIYLLREGRAIPIR